MWWFITGPLNKAILPIREEQSTLRFPYDCWVEVSLLEIGCLLKEMTFRGTKICGVFSRRFAFRFLPCSGAWKMYMFCPKGRKAPTVSTTSSLSKYPMCANDSQILFNSIGRTIQYPSQLPWTVQKREEEAQGNSHGSHCHFSFSTTSTQKPKCEPRRFRKLNSLGIS